MEDLIYALHQKALLAAQNFRRAESELITILQAIEKHRVYVQLGHASLFAYAVDELRLSEANACNFIAVARKAKEVPALKEEIQAGNLTVSKARKLTPVLTPENAGMWIEKAKTLPKRLLEREIASVRPESMTPVGAHYVSRDRLHLELGVSEELMEQLVRIKDILSQKRRRPVSLEEALEAIARDYLQRHDPLEKAQRAMARGAKGSGKVESSVPGQIREGKAMKTKISSAAGNPSAAANLPGHIEEEELPWEERMARSSNPHVREAVKQMIKHEVANRDRGRCTYVHPNGQRCRQQRWLEIHHIIPVSKGGPDTVENLTTLCFRHHRWLHERHNQPSQQMGAGQQGQMFGLTETGTKD